ncbi:MAG: aminotransferase class V-fold PLP-dependent enzyme [Parachlamydiaceae bacterium]
MIKNISDSFNTTAFEYEAYALKSSLIYVAGLISGVVTVGWLGTIYLRRWNESTVEMIGRNLLHIPYVKRKFDTKVKEVGEKEAAHVRMEWEEIKQNIAEALGRNVDNEVFKFRDEGYPVDEVLKIFDAINRIVRKNIANKQFSGAIYPNELKEERIAYPARVQGQSDLAYLFTVIQSQTPLWNTLHKEFSPVRFLLYWEKEMVASMLGALPHTTVGFDTTGGTASLMQAVRMYRERGREERGIGPGCGVMIAPKSIHAAELKGGKAYDVTFVLIDCDETGAADIDKMKEAIEKHKTNLLAVFASAPCYGTGTVDPIKEIIACANAYKVPVHIDACLRGFVRGTNFFKDGASSVSIDPHKYGEAPKGSSLLLVKNELAKYSVYAFPDWTCVYGTPKDEGSQACSTHICAFTALLYYGREAYLKTADRIEEGKNRLVSYLKQIDDIEVVGRSDLNVVAFRCKIKEGATYALVHEMSKRNWELNALKDNMAHLCLTKRILDTEGCFEHFTIALNESIRAVRQLAEKGIKFPGDAGLYCSMGEALMPDVKNLPFTKYIENKLLGKKGAEETVKAHIVSQLNPAAA